MTRFLTAPAKCPAHLYILAFSPDQLEHWLTRFAMCKDRKPYPLNTLHQLILCYVRKVKPTIDFFKDKEFASLRRILDAEMKSPRLTPTKYHAPDVSLTPSNSFSRSHAHSPVSHAHNMCTLIATPMVGARAWHL